MKIINNCLVCNTSTPNKMYCSLMCRDKSRHEKSHCTIFCKMCNIPFVIRTKRNSIYCSSKCVSADDTLNKLKVSHAKETNLKKYGVEFPMQCDSVKQNLQASIVEKYGVNHVFQSKIVKDKIKKTILQKYGVEHPMQSEEIKKKSKNTISTNYGGYGFASPNLSKKIKDTMIKSYGVDNPMKSKDILKITQDTNLKKYGFITPLKNKSVIDKTNHTLVTKYGISNISQLPNIRKKIDQTVKTDFYQTLFENRLNKLSVPLFDITKYKSSHYNNLYNFQCTKCNNIFDDHLYSGKIPLCPLCYPKYKSYLEKEMNDFLITFKNIEFQSQTRKIIDLELDFYIPDKLLAIEMDGIYWHSEISGNKPKDYHFQKTELCLKKNIQLIHIFEDEWLFQQKKVKSLITNLLGNSVKIYARNTKIIEISASQSNQFLSDNHLQGSDKASVRLALINKEDQQIVALMTFCKSRYDKMVEWEMSRFCNVVNTSVIGGASKLFKYFIKTYQPKSIVSYSDRRYFNGNLYKTIGMKFIKYTPPAYFYIKDRVIIGNRMKFQKHKLSNILTIFDCKKTEWENMKTNGFDRIWDCGHAKFIWTS